jgi:hypothetical protein
MDVVLIVCEHSPRHMERAEPLLSLSPNASVAFSAGRFTDADDSASDRSDPLVDDEGAPLDGAAAASGGKKYDVSLAVFFQVFLVVSLSLLVVTISLLFRYFSIVAVDRIKLYYLETAAVEVAARVGAYFRQGDEALHVMVQDPLAMAAATASSAGAAAALANTTVGAAAAHWLEQCAAVQHLFGDMAFAVAAVSTANGSVVCGARAATGADNCWVVERDTASQKVTGSAPLVSPWDHQQGAAATANRTALSATMLDAVRFQVPPSVWSTAPGKGAGIAFTELAQDGDTHAFLRAAHRMWLSPDAVAVVVRDGAAVRRGLLVGWVQEQMVGIVAWLGAARTTSPNGGVGATPAGPLLSTEQGRAAAELEQHTVTSVVPLGLALPAAARDTRLLLEVAVAMTEGLSTELQQNVSLIVVVSLGILVAMCMAGSLSLRLLLAPLALLKADVRAANQLQLNRIPQRRSVVREVQAMMASFTTMVARLRGYKPFLTEVDEAAVLGKDAAKNHSLSSTRRRTEAAAARHLLRVRLRYVTRKTNLIKGLENFDHSYSDGDAAQLEKLLEACKKIVKVHAFDTMTLAVEEKQRAVAITSNRQLQELILMANGEIQLVMKKGSVRKLLSPVALLVDLANMVVNVLLAASVLFAPASSADRLSIFVFVGFYGGAMMVNMGIALWLLKTGQRHDRFRRWMSQAGLEVSLLLLLASQSTQHIHFLWSQWSILGALNFNAPRILAVWERSVSFSYFGFVFSDLMQLVFKMYRISAIGGSLQALTVVAMCLSVASVSLSVPKKLAHFAVAKRRWTAVGGDDMADMDAMAGDDDNMSGDGDILPAGRTRWGQVRTLTGHETTVVLMQLVAERGAGDGDGGAAVHVAADRLAAECSFFYSTVLRQVKAAGGTMLFFHGREMAAIFNKPKPVARHCFKAVACARACQKELAQQFALRMIASVVTDVHPVGNLGSTHRKSFQCIGPYNQLRRMNQFAEARRLDLLATGKCLEHLAPHRNTVHCEPVDTFFDGGSVLHITAAHHHHHRQREHEDAGVPAWLRRKLRRETTDILDADVDGSRLGQGMLNIFGLRRIDRLLVMPRLRAYLEQWLARDDGVAAADTTVPAASAAAAAAGSNKLAYIDDSSGGESDSDSDDELQPPMSLGRTANFLLGHDYPALVSGVDEDL